jgi:hypothetical protein
MMHSFEGYYLEFHRSEECTINYFNTNNRTSRFYRSDECPISYFNTIDRTAWFYRSD